ncbi:hypothetical protein PAPHI01_1523 [Pancytospora philotis]|nr:hypothetical protein PAPHI01_1523 [Pancytospora philotis]
MLQSIPLRNKPLCIAVRGTTAYIGDARGNIYTVEHPYTHPRVLRSNSSPVSSIVFADQLIYGDWDGTVHTENASRRLGRDMVKAMAVFDGRLFVSVDRKLFVLGLDLAVLEEHDTPAKIYSMDVHGGAVHFGMARGLVASYCGGYHAPVDSGRDGDIISLRSGCAGSTRGELCAGGRVLYSSDKWIRSVWDESLFAAGPCVLQHGNVLHSHADDVVGVARIDDAVISIGLDCCYKVHIATPMLSENEEKELMDLLNS